MKLFEVISELQKYPREHKCAHGFRNPHSYRGYYDQLAFEPVENITVGEMLDAAKEANGAIYQGWKGGTYHMSLHTQVWIADVGTTGSSEDPLTFSELRMMLTGHTELPTGVMNEVLEERRKQDAKWGEQNHPPFIWQSILMEEVGEASQAILTGFFNPSQLVAERVSAESNYRHELIQVAAVAIAAIESFDRNQ